MIFDDTVLPLSPTAAMYHRIPNRSQPNLRCQQLGGLEIEGNQDAMIL
jgi:hypothetical protein